MARGQGDYFQATRGGGHGDYRHIVLAPVDLTEAVQLTQLAFHLAERWRNPVLVYGDYLLAHTSEAVDVTPIDFGSLPAKDWAIDGSLGGSGHSRNVNPLGFEKGQHGIDPEAFWNRLAAKHEQIARDESRCEAEGCDDADFVVVAFGTPARFARHVVRELRAEGARLGHFRPITLWPFPSAALAEIAKTAKRIAVFEQNAGQMIDDVRLAVLGAAEVVAIGGISTDSSGFGVGSMLDVARIRGRIRLALGVG
jgi:2-oxoglutarate ferredoxin oxidoreductase subunit alpha